MTNNINERVVYHLKKSLFDQDQDINPDSLLVDDLGLDSMGIVEFVTSIEEEFGIKIDDFEIDNIKTLEDSTKLIQSKIH
jgi:acyl carrier protein